MWKPGEVRGLAVEQRAALPGSTESTQRLSLSRFRRSRSQEWRTSRAVSRRPLWKRTPGWSRNRKRAPSFSIRTSDASHGTIRVPSTAQVSVSNTLGRTSACSTVPVSDGSRLRTTPWIGTCRTPPPICALRRGGLRRRRRLAELGVVDVRGGRVELEAADRRVGDPVVHVVEERDQDRRSRAAPCSNFR